jgi:hypothetical protein
MLAGDNCRVYKKPRQTTEIKAVADTNERRLRKPSHAGPADVSRALLFCLSCIVPASSSLAGLAGLPAPGPARWTAFWIWDAGRQATVNYHFHTRRVFELGEAATSASLHVSAQTDYQLYINGRFVGRGPTPSDPAWQSYDTYDVSRLLVKGKNVIAIACHNDGVGTHWQYAGPGGVICQLEVETPSGKQSVVTNGAWKVKEADCYDLRSPRFFWSCGFAETFHADRFDPAWTSMEYDDSGWKAAQVLGPHPTRPWQRLMPREIPFLVDAKEFPVALEEGSFALEGVHSVRFDSLLPLGRSGLVYAQTSFFSDA